MRARNGAGPSAWSATVEAATNPGQPGKVAPAAPTNLRLFPVEAAEIVVTWTAQANNAVGHEVQFRASGDLVWLPGGFPPASEASVTLSGTIVPGKIYEARVRAYHEQGSSDWLGPVSVQAGMETAIEASRWVDLITETIADRVAGNVGPHIVIRGKEITLAPLSELKRMLEDALARQSEFRSAVGTTWMRLGRSR